LRGKPSLRTAVLSALLWCSVAASATAQEYQLGHGYDLGPLNFAGYSNVVVKAPAQGQTSLSIDDLSLFVSGHFNSLINPFVEAELTDLTLVHSAPTRRGEGDGDIVLERLYNDSYLSGSTTLRIGKMLSPVGEWNEIHAAPLVLSITRPAVTYRNFSEYATGVSLRYTDPDLQLPDVQAYLQPSGEFSERPHTITRTSIAASPARMSASRWDCSTRSDSRFSNRRT
jgi:hypothetical protein